MYTYKLGIVSVFESTNINLGIFNKIKMMRNTLYTLCVLIGALKEL